MDTFRTRAARAIRAGWGILEIGLAGGIIAILLGGRSELTLALGLAALAIAIAFGLNLTLLVIVWRREMRHCKPAAEPLAVPDAPSYEQPAPM